jgi:hypothetical protein
MPAALSQKPAKHFDFSIWHLDDLFYCGRESVKCMQEADLLWQILGYCLFDA